MRAGWRVALAAFAIGAAATGLSARAIVAVRAPAGVVAALLEEGRIVFIDVANGATLAEYPERAVPPGHALSAGRLARAPKRDEVLGILSEETGAFVIGIHARTFAARRIGRLPSGRYPGLAVGEKTGRIFAFSDAGVTVYALVGEGAEPQLLLRTDLARDVYAGAVSADERRLYVSYHGRGTGVHWFDLTDDGWRSGGYVQTHGNFALAAGRLLAATGDPAIVEFDLDGRFRSQVNTGLENSHLMEFAVDEPRHTIYAVGSCGYTGGFSVSQWPGAGFTGRLLVPPRDYSVCGERVSIAPAGDWLAVAWRAEPSPPGVGSSAGRLLVVDTRTGSVLQRVPTSSTVVDVLAVR
jgi:hypothetical protein